MNTNAQYTEERARMSLGQSSRPILHMVDRCLAGRHPGQGVLLDVGCGAGSLWSILQPRFDRYLGADVVQYDGFPEAAEFHKIDLDTGRVPLPDATADVVAAVETIEHLENPRSFVRELVRLCRPGGWVIITTPNQLSFLSKVTLLIKNQFNAFQAGSYPAHITALLEIDLRRIANECALQNPAIVYSQSGRIMGTPWHYPRIFSRLLPRACSDNVALIGQKI